jgi:hypothetical protein
MIVVYIPSSLCLALTSQPTATGTSTQLSPTQLPPTSKTNAICTDVGVAATDLFHLEVHPFAIYSIVWVIVAVDVIA